eukprot:TRINITY_DN8914_c0_g1_i4.p1 TRINITY_DN8914_c0_g1~~TRINITY_DN8914_c0_g1_i4.p1  ORF type:complete len:174 (+),score=19.67 TRINITY_DN8914_c0_g1_i4:192-713(+)
MLVMSSIVKMLPLTPSTIARSQPSIRLLQQRTIFQMWQGWMRTVWNRVDSNRQDLVGKDRLAAEWILKLGGAAELSLPPNSAKWYRNYNGLPWLGDTNRGVKPKNTCHVLKIDATSTEVTNTGLTHLDGLKHLTDLYLRDAKYIDNNALQVCACSMPQIHLTRQPPSTCVFGT